MTALRVKSSFYDGRHGTCVLIGVMTLNDRRSVRAKPGLGGAVALLIVTADEAGGDQAPAIGNNEEG